MKRRIAFLVLLTLIFTTVLGFNGYDAKNSFAATNYTLQKVSFVNAVVTATALNIRQGPSMNYRIVCILKKGQTVKVLGKVENWYAVYEPKTGCMGAASGTYIKDAAATNKPVPTPTPAAPPSTGITADEQAMLNLINKARTDSRVPALTFDMNVVKIARLKAKDMVNKNYFSHQSPTYGSPFDMMRKFGISFRTAGENIAGNRTIQGAFNAWMGSEGHKKNIMNANFNYTGIGIQNSPTYGKIFVQMFIGK